MDYNDILIKLKSYLKNFDENYSENDEEESDSSYYYYDNDDENDNENNQNENDSSNQNTNLNPETNQNSLNSDLNFDLDQLWITIIDIAQNNVDMLGNYYPYLEKLMEINENFQKNNPNLINELIHQTKVDLNIQTLITLCRLLPFFNNENTFNFIDLLIHFLQTFTINEKQIPNFLQRIIKEILFDSVDNERILNIYNQIENHLNDETIGSFLSFSCFCEYFITKIHQESKLFNHIKNYLENSSFYLVSLSCLFLLKTMSQYLIDTEYDQQQIINLFIPVLINENEQIRDFALNVLETFISDGIILTRFCVSSFISNFSLFQTKKENIFQFFSCLKLYIKTNITIEDADLGIEEEDFEDNLPENDDSSEDKKQNYQYIDSNSPLTQIIIENEDNPQDQDEEDIEFFNIIQDIFLFSLSWLQKDCDDKDILINFIRSETIHIIAKIIDLFPKTFKHFKNQLLALIYPLIDQKKYEYFYSISIFLRSAIDNHLILPSKMLIPKIDIIINSFHNELVGSLEDQLACIKNISYIARIISKKFIVPLYYIGYNSLMSDSEDNAVISSKILGNIARSLELNQIINVFMKISDFILSTNNSHNFIVFLTQMIQIISNKEITPDLVQSFIDKLFESQKLIINQGKLTKNIKILKKLFQFLNASAILKKAPKIIPLLLSLIKEETSSATNELVKCSISCLSNNLFSEEELKDYTSSILNIYEQITIQQDALLSSICDFLRLVFIKKPSLISPQIIIDKISSIIDEIDYDDEEEEEEEESNDKKEYESIPSQAILLFTIYLNTINLKINKNLCKSLMRHLIVSSDDEIRAKLLIDCLIRMYQEETRFVCIQVPSLQIFAQILTMKQEEIDDIGISSGNILSMKQFILDALSYDQSFLPLITEDISSSNEKMEKFKLLFSQ